MSTETLSSVDPSDFKASNNEYAELHVEASRLSQDDLAESAGLIQSSIKYATDKGASYKDAYLATKADYVDDEPNPALKEFGRLLLLAPSMAQATEQVQSIDAGMSENRGNAQELQDMRRKITRAVCAYNGALGTFLTDQLQSQADEALQISPVDVSDWLAEASGNRRWAEGVTLGVTGEIAAQELLASAHLPGLRHGTVDEDLEGKDYVFDQTSLGYSSVDIKTGKDRPILPVSINERGRPILSIDPSHLKGFSVDEKYRDGYLYEIKDRLM